MSFIVLVLGINSILTFTLDRVETDFDKVQKANAERISQAVGCSDSKQVLYCCNGCVGNPHYTMRINVEGTAYQDTQIVDQNLGVRIAGSELSCGDVTFTVADGGEYGMPGGGGDTPPFDGNSYSPDWGSGRNNKAYAKGVFETNSTVSVVSQTPGVSCTKNSNQQTVCTVSDSTTADTIRLQYDVTPLEGRLQASLGWINGLYTCGGSREQMPSCVDNFEIGGTSEVLTFQNGCKTPQLESHKTVDEVQAERGEQVTYTIDYSNNGSASADNVVIEDTFTQNYSDLEFVSQSSDPPITFDDSSLADGVLRWNTGSVAAAGIGSVTAVFNVRNDATIGDDVLNNAFANADNTDPTDPSQAQVEIIGPEVLLDKNVDKQQVGRGEEFTYTINYENTGSAAIQSAIITDTFSQNYDQIEFVSQSSDPQVTFDDTDLISGILRWNVGTLNPTSGSVSSITVVYRANIDAPGGTLVPNEAILTGDNIEPTEPSLEEVEIIAPEMDIEKTVDITEAAVGDQIEYTITFRNNGNGVATGVVITDRFTENGTYLDYVSSNPEGIETTAGYQWTIGDVGPGVEGNISIIFNVNNTAVVGGQIVNMAAINGDNFPDPDPVDSTVTIVGPNIEVEKVADKTEAEPGDTINYTITYRNTGDGIARGVEIIDTFANDEGLQYLTYASANPSNVVEDCLVGIPENPPVNGCSYAWSIGDLNPGAKGTVVISFTVNNDVSNGTQIRNTAFVRGSNFVDTNPVEEIVTVITPELAIQKLVDKTNVQRGETVTYTITYENIGNAVARGVEIRDRFIENFNLLTNVDATPSFTSETNGELLWGIGDVAPEDGEKTIEISFTISAQSNRGDVIRNVASINAENAEEEETEEVLVLVEIEPGCANGIVEGDEDFDEEGMVAGQGRILIDITDSCGNKDGTVVVTATEGGETTELTFSETEWQYLDAGEYTYVVSPTDPACGEPYEGTLTIEECQEEIIELDLDALPVCGDGNVDSGEEMDDGTGGGGLNVSITNACGQEDGNVFLEGPNGYIANIGFDGEIASQTGATAGVPAGEEICIAAGEEVSGENICCEGLQSIENQTYNTETEECEAGTQNICSDCGNGTCEDHENQCNCAEDCEVEPITLLEYIFGNTPTAYAQTTHQMALPEGTYTYTATPADGCGEERTGTIEITGCQITPLSFNMETGEEPGEPTLTKEVNGSSQVTLSAGSTGTYTLTYTNGSNESLQNVVISDPFNNTNQQYIRFVSENSDSGVSFSQSDITWTVGTLEAGASGTIEIIFEIYGRDDLPESSLTIENDGNMTWDGGSDSTEIVRVIVPYAATTGAGTIMIVIAGVVGVGAAAVYVLSKQGIITLFKK